MDCLASNYIFTLWRCIDSWPPSMLEGHHWVAIIVSVFQIQLKYWNNFSSPYIDCRWNVFLMDLQQQSKKLCRSTLSSFCARFKFFMQFHLDNCPFNYRIIKKFDVNHFEFITLKRNEAFRFIWFHIVNLETEYILKIK